MIQRSSSAFQKGETQPCPNIRSIWIIDPKFDLDNKNKNFWVSEKGVSLFFLLNEIIRIRFDHLVEEEKKVGFKKKIFDFRPLLSALEPKNTQNQLKNALRIFNLINIKKRAKDLNQYFSKRGGRPLSDGDLDLVRRGQVRSGISEHEN